MLREEEMPRDELWLGIKISIHETAKKHIPSKPKSKATQLLRQKILDLADDRRQLKEAGLSQQSRPEDVKRNPEGKKRSKQLSKQVV